MRIATYRAYIETVTPTRRVDRGRARRRLGARRAARTLVTVTLIRPALTRSTDDREWQAQGRRPGRQTQDARSGPAATQAARSREGRCKWLVDRSAWSARSLAVGAFVYALPDDRRSPTPTRTSRPQTTVRLLRRRQDRARPVRRPRTASRSRSTRCRRHMQDAVVAAENRTFWTNKGIDPKGILRAAFSNAQRQRHPGRVDDHPAVRQDPLPDPGAQPTSARSRRRSSR